MELNSKMTDAEIVQHLTVLLGVDRQSLFSKVKKLNDNHANLIESFEGLKKEYLKKAATHGDLQHLIDMREAKILARIAEAELLNQLRLLLSGKTSHQVFEEFVRGQ
jgi:hypothetical protein